MGLIIFLVVVVALVGWYFSTYNTLIRKRSYVDEAFSQVDVQLQRRNDLIPNLVNTVKGYASHESDTLEAVIKARQQLISLPKDATPEQVNAMSNQLSGSLSRLMVVSEAYPDLKANENFNQLQGQLVNTEDKIAVSRSLYNSSVTTYNRAIQTVPTNIVAGMANFEARKLLETPQESRAVPTVQF